MDDMPSPHSIRYIFSTEPDVHLRVAHGIWGGVNPHGEIELNFYDETDVPPADTEQTIEADGSLSAERMAKPDAGRTVSRQIHTRILLNYNTARALLNWLENRMTELEAMVPADVYNMDSGIQQ